MQETVWQVLPVQMFWKSFCGFSSRTESRVRSARPHHMLLNIIFHAAILWQPSLSCANRQMEWPPCGVSFVPEKRSSAQLVFSLKNTCIFLCFSLFSNLFLHIIPRKHAVCGYEMINSGMRGPGHAERAAHLLVHSVVWTAVLEPTSVFSVSPTWYCPTRTPMEWR